MKRRINQFLLLIFSTVFFFSNRISVKSYEVNLIKSEDWYYHYDSLFTTWSKQMNQDYTRYYPGDINSFRHMGLSLDEVLNKMTVNGQKVDVALAHESDSETDYRIDAIYSTASLNHPNVRLITYFIVTTKDGTSQTLVTEQLDMSILINFTPTANLDLAQIVFEVEEYYGPESSQAIETKTSEENYTLLPNSFDLFNQFLMDYYPEDHYQIFLGGPMTEADGSPLRLEYWIDNELYIFGDPIESEYKRVCTLYKPDGSGNGEIIGIIQARDQFEFYAIFSDASYKPRHYTWLDDPGLIEGYMKTHYDFDGNSLTQKADHELVDLYLNRDQTFSLAEFEKYVRESFVNPPFDHSMEVGQTYLYERDGMDESLAIDSSAEGNYEVRQSTGGPVYSFQAFLANNQLIIVTWHRGPEGTVYKKNRDTYEIEGEFTIYSEQVGAYWDLIHGR